MIYFFFKRTNTKSSFRFGYFWNPYLVKILDWPIFYYEHENYFKYNPCVHYFK